MDPIRTLVVDDDATLATIHRHLLESLEGFVWIGWASNGMDLLSIIEDQPVDLLLMDLRLGDMHGLDVLRLLRKDSRAVDAVCISVDHTTETITEALRLGAFDYLLKPVSYERFQETLRAYRNYRRLADEVDDVPDQATIDALR